MTETITQKIRIAIEEHGGINEFTNSIKRRKQTGRPSRNNMIIELQELSQAEINVAWFLKLIGNSNRIGSIVENSLWFK